VEPDGPQEGRTEHRPDNNVVPFPRDWLGPRDELVPVGRRDCDGAPNGAQEPSSPASSARVVDSSPDLPPRAEDFWGEGSGAIHGVLQAADPGEPNRTRLTRRRITLPPIQRPFMRANARAIGLSVVALASVGLVTAGVIVLTGNATHRTIIQSVPRQTIGMSTTIISALHGSGATVRGSARSREPRSARRPSRNAGARQHRSPPTATARGRTVSPVVNSRATPTYPANQESIVSSPQAASVSSPQGASVSYSEATGPSSPAASLGERGGATSSSTPSHASSSTSRPPFGPNGTLGPGSSPNS
jgi:hypothetical protein